MQPTDKSPFPGYSARWQVGQIESTAPLPLHVKTIDKKIRIPVDLDSMPIQGDDGVKRKLTLRSSLLAADGDLFRASCAVIIHALDGRRKTSVVVRWTSEFSLFLRTVQSENLNRRTNTVTLAMYNWYAAKKNASQAKLLRSLLLYWSSLDVPGLASDLRTFLADSAPPKTPSPIEVQNRSPKERPLSNESVRRLLDKIGELYAAGQFDEQDHLLWRLLVSEGMRPSQLALFIVEDVTISGTQTGAPSVTLRIPYPKQRGTAARDYMVDHELSSSVSFVVVQHIELLERILRKPPLPSTPLFCLIRTNVLTAGYSVSTSCLNISAYIQRTAEKISGLTGTDEDVQLFSRRLKHTKLTHLAQKGASVEVLAAAAFQTSTNSVARYVNLTEESFEEVEAQMAGHHDRLLDLFRGSIVDRDDATHTDPECVFQRSWTLISA
jgi:integrase